MKYQKEVSLGSYPIHILPVKEKISAKIKQNKTKTMQYFLFHTNLIPTAQIAPFSRCSLGIGGVIPPSNQGGRPEVVTKHPRLRSRAAGVQHPSHDFRRKMDIFRYEFFVYLCFQCWRRGISFVRVLTCIVGIVFLWVCVVRVRVISAMEWEMILFTAITCLILELSV